MRIHPLVAGAAASVIVACGVGVAAMTGVLPRTLAEKAEVPPPSAKKECAECGVVLNVRMIEQNGDGTGLGAVGGVAGAVVGHEISHGRDVGTVVGAAGGGAFAGHQIE